MADFTKGEWNIYPTNHTGVDLKIAIHILDQGIAYLSKDLVNYLANAHLIAAAPDMYEALKALVEYHQKYGGVVPNLTNANRALAKAEGREQ